MQETTFSQTRINKRILIKDNKPKVTEHSISTLTVTEEIHFLYAYQSCFTSYFFRFKLVSLYANLILWWKFGIQMPIQHF